MTRVISPFRILSTLLLACVASSVAPLDAQTPAKPAAPQTKAPPKAPAKPAARTPAPAPAAAKPAEPAPPPKPVVQDVRMKTVYTAADQKTESVTYQKGARERFEFGSDVIVLKQHDLKRTVQIMRAANMYMVVPDGAPPAMPVPAAAPNTPPQKPGVVTMNTTIADTGERKTMFGMQARHVKTTIDKQPMPGACDTTKQHIETDGWYVDVPLQSQLSDLAPQQPSPGGCVDELKATQNGDPKVLGFPISYSTTITGEDGKPGVVAMEITEFERTSLDAALFDIPPGMNDAGNLQALSKAMSDVNETKLAQELTATAAPVQKIPGAVLVGVPEVVNKTTQQIDTRDLRGRLVSELAAAKLNAAPLAGAQPDLVQQAAAHGYDYVLLVEITDLKVSKAGGGLGGMLKAASKVTGGGGSNEDPAEAAITLKLVQPDGKPRLTTTVKGKTGGLDLKTGLGVAKFAGGMYMNMMTGKMFMGALNPAMAGNLGGLGMLGNPAMMSMQTQGLGMKAGMQMGTGMGIDPTAGAASFLTQQSMASKALTTGLPGQASFDGALGEAFQNAAKAVSENLKKGEPKKK
jgi:hypothetical protein